MRRLRLAALMVLAFALPADARLVIEGRDAQKLHCAALLTVVTARLDAVGILTPEDRGTATLVAALIMLQLPGTAAERGKALEQRSEKLLRERSARQLFHEFKATSRWCRTNFTK